MAEVPPNGTPKGGGGARFQGLSRSRPAIHTSLHDSTRGEAVTVTCHRHGFETSIYLGKRSTGCPRHRVIRQRGNTPRSFPFSKLRSLGAGRGGGRRHGTLCTEPLRLPGGDACPPPAPARQVCGAPRRARPPQTQQSTRLRRPELPAEPPQGAPRPGLCVRTPSHN